MGKLNKMGFTLEEMSHIEGKTRRQKAYFLTDDGMLHARNLREKILTWKVHLKRTDGQIISCKLSEINSKLKTNLSPLKIYMNISEEGKILEEDLISGMPKEKKDTAAKIFHAKGEIFWIDDLIGRDAELNKIQDWINSASIGTVVIYGSVGIGKSVLLAETVKRLRDKKNIFWYEMSEADSQYEIIDSFSEFLKKQKDRTLSNYLEEHEKLELAEVLRILDKGLADSDTLLTFDNYFQVSEDVADFFAGLCGLASKYRNIKLLIGARDTTPFYCRFYDKSEIKRKKIAELTLKGLDEEGIKHLLDAPYIEKDALRKIHLMTRGHPLTIELIKKGDVNSLKRIKGFSRQEASLLLYLKGVES
jgi:hypothetical protein